MVVQVSNPSGDRNDKIANAAKVLGRSKHRKAVFKAIYTGKKKIKKVSEISKTSELSNVRVLQEAKRLASEDIIHQLSSKINCETAYEKIDFYTHNRDAILRFASNKDKLDKFPTKTNPGIRYIQIKVPVPKFASTSRRSVSVKQITIDDIDSFAKVKRFRSSDIKNWSETQFKKGIKSIIGERGKFTDWGGETNDLFTTRILIGKKRHPTAFAFKGKGTKGILTPKKMGKNADQIQRLFKSPADVFIIQYHGQINESVLDQMHSLATAKSAQENRTIYFGIINGTDSRRIITAYKKFFVE
jgi:hypothetical protein